MLYDEALERLLAGNQRYAAMQQLHPRQTTFRREALVDGQNPIAAVLSCSDSRVPSELIFDQGLGDLFIVRTAGHTMDNLVLASLEYAVFALHVPLVMVLGHGQCGAVTAVMKAQELPGHMPQLAAHLRPALENVNPDAANSIDEAIRANTRYTAAELGRTSPIFSQALRQDQVRVASAYYDMGTGRVEILD